MDPFVIYTDSVISENEYFQEFNKMSIEPFTITENHPSLQLWKSIMKKEKKYTSTLYIFSIGTTVKNDNFDIIDIIDVYNFESHYDKKGKSSKEIDLIRIHTNEYLECTFSSLEKENYYFLQKDLFSFLQTFKPSNEYEYGMHLEIYCPNIFDTNKILTIYIPTDEYVQKMKNLCNEIKYKPRPKQTEQFYNVFLGGICFLETEEHYNNI